MDWTKDFEAISRRMDIERYELEVQGVLTKTWKEGELIILSRWRIGIIRKWLLSKGQKNEIK